MTFKKYRYLFMTGILTLVFAGGLFLPAQISFGATPDPYTGFIMCGTSSPDTCHIKDLFVLIDKVLQFIIKDVIVVLATVVIIYAGLMTLYEASQGKETTVYRKIIWNVILGMVFALGSYVIVKSLLLMLIDPNSTFAGAIKQALSLSSFK